MVKDAYEDRSLILNIGRQINSDEEFNGHDSITLNSNGGPTDRDVFVLIKETPF